MQQTQSSKFKDTVSSRVKSLCLQYSQSPPFDVYAKWFILSYGWNCHLNLALVIMFFASSNDTPIIDSLFTETSWSPGFKRPS